MILLFITETFEKSYPLFKEPFSVVIPVYNENEKDLKECIKSVYLARGEKEIIIVDDGSTKEETINFLKKLEKNIKLIENLKCPIKIFYLEKNMGKRSAHKKGFLNARYDIIAVVDSDTLVREDSFINLLKPFNNREVGATTGDIRPINENENLTTKVQGAKYWTGLNIDRKSQSYWGIVTCCSGALSAYRKELVIKHLEEYINQTFLGEKCNSGDDRYLTNLILKDWKVKYAEDAIAYTRVPNTFKKWTKQSLRWKRSFIRESFICLRNSAGKKNLLFFETLLNLVLPILFVGIRIAFVISIILYPIFILLTLPVMIFATLVRNAPMFFESPKRIFYSFVYAIYYNFIFYWLYFVALFTFKNTKWLTR